MAMQIVAKIDAAHETTVMCIAFDQAHSVVYVGAEHPDIKAWSLRASGGVLLATLKAHKGHLSSLAFCDGLNILISGAVDGLIILWDERFKIVQVRAAG
jgi:WD40 repeat protein